MQLDEYSKEVVDRFIRSMGYDPNHIDRDKRMAFTKTIRFQQFAKRMGSEAHEEYVHEQDNHSPTMKNRPYTKGLAQSRAHTKDMALKRSVHVNKPQMSVKTEGCGCKHSAAEVVKDIYKKKKLQREELYDHEKDDKNGTTYGKKPSYKQPKEDVVSDKKSQAAAVLKGGTTLTGQNRDTVEIDPLLKRNKPGSPNQDVGGAN
jgi:hypothetical protein